MPKMLKSIEIVISTNKRLSSMSLDSRREIKDILSKKYADVRITDVNTLGDLEKVIARKPDLVFLGMKYILDSSQPGDKKIWLSRKLSGAGITFTGSEEAASMLEHDKHLAKQQVQQYGLASASSQLISPQDTYCEEDITLPYPIFVKPVDGGGGSGINESSLVRNFNELEKQVSWLTSNLQTDALLESYLPGREFSVGLLRKQSSDDFHLLPLEIVAPPNHAGVRFLSSRIKSADLEHTLEVADPNLKTLLNKLALDSFNALGGRDYGRIDIRLDAYGAPNFLEANLLPSLLNNYGNLPKASLINMQLPHDDLILQIAELGLSRQTPAVSLDFALSGELQELRLQPAV